MHIGWFLGWLAVSSCSEDGGIPVLLIHAGVQPGCPLQGKRLVWALVHLPFIFYFLLFFLSFRSSLFICLSCQNDRGGREIF